ncbi:hypothetical protein BJ878DRAFT_135961 [Calycina marina]|uniref:Uncharacterized protein n=1 Tax=Calycina marina TaxID=1763456 RepID=A0A9P8CDT7_9HELO|nr:hypothetical protein BJ878DRAFT_135961 [Calycina marina]
MASHRTHQHHRRDPHSDCGISRRSVSANRPRAPFIFISMCMILLGFIMALAGSAHGGGFGVVYAAVFIATCGIYPVLTGKVTWLFNNFAGSYKRSAGMATHVGIGNLACVMASNFYRTADKPKYFLGHELEIGFMGVGMCAVVLRSNFMSQCKKG